MRAAPSPFLGMEILQKKTLGDFETVRRNLAQFKTAITFAF
jgi:hypothetical protein